LYYKKLFSESEIKEVSEALDAYFLDLYPPQRQICRKNYRGCVQKQYNNL